MGQFWKSVEHVLMSLSAYYSIPTAMNVCIVPKKLSHLASNKIQYQPAILGVELGYLKGIEVVNSCLLV